MDELAIEIKASLILDKLTLILLISLASSF